MTLPCDGCAGTSLLKCTGIRFGYDKRPVLDGIDLTVEEGDFVGVIGPNGSGKSTLVKLMSGLLTPLGGDVAFKGRDMAELSRREVAKELAVVAQEETVDFGFNVAEEVMLGRSPHHGGLHFESNSDRDLVEDAMRKTGVQHLADRKTEALSGGERQRVRIARALAQQPRVLLLDEPTNHLDLYSQLSLTELMHSINQDGLAIVLVSHDINFVSRSCRRIEILHEGRLRFGGPPHEVITEANLRSCFHIEAVVDANPITGGPRMTPIGRVNGGL